MCEQKVQRFLVPELTAHIQIWRVYHTPPTREKLLDHRQLIGQGLRLNQNQVTRQVSEQAVFPQKTQAFLIA